MNHARRIKLACPYVDARIEEAVLAVLRSGQLVCGPRVAQFETRLAERLGCRYAVMVSSGTSALYLSMAALGVDASSEVLVPVFTFPAAAMAAHALGARVRFCDVEADTFNLSVRTVDAAWDKSVSLVVAVDQFGNPAPCDALAHYCAERKVPLLVDAACSLGASLNGVPCGTMGDAAIFSFHPRKIVTTGEGGMVLTNDAHLARLVRRHRNLGIENGQFVDVGMNLRPSEIGASIGLIQLEMLDKMIEERQRVMREYRKLPLVFQETIGGAESSWQTAAATLPEQGGRSLRDDLISYLAQKDIEAQVGGYSLSAISQLAQRFGVFPEAFPVSWDLHNNSVALPLYFGIEQSDVERVIAAVREFWDNRFDDRFSQL